MLFSFLIFVAVAVGTTIDSSMPSDLLYEDFYTSEKSNPIAPDDYSVLFSNPGDFTFDSSQNLGFDDFSFLASNDQASSDLSDQLFDSNSLNSAIETSCNTGKSDKEVCSVDSAPQGRLELPDLLQMGNTIIQGDPLLAPITIETQEKSPGKCVNALFPLNLCCKGKLGALAVDSYPLTVFETINRCRPGK